MSSGLGAIHRTAHGTRTLMDRSMGQFLDGFVFFGPDEVKRLLDEGYPTDAADALNWMFDGG